MRKPIDILLYFAVHGRHDLLKVCIRQVQLLMKYDPLRFNIIPFAVCSSDADSAILTAAGIDNIQHRNDFLGEKKNAGLAYALEKFTFDYMLEIGSDDLIHPYLLEEYLPYFKAQIGMISANQCYFIEIPSGKVATWKTDVIIGAGRCIHRSLLSRMHKTEFLFNTSCAGADFDYRFGQAAMLAEKSALSYERIGFGKRTGKGAFCLWTPNKQNGLDTDSLFHLKMTTSFSHEQVTTNRPLIIDLKNGDNINPFSRFVEINATVKETLKDYDPEIIFMVQFLCGQFQPEIIPEKPKTKRRKK